MRLTTKFSAFVTLLTSLTIFVTLIGASLSFYNGIQLKMTNRVQAVATMLDNRLVSMSFDQIEPQMDELMTPIDATRVDFQLNGKSVYSHSRTDNYRPLGSSNQFRDITVPSLK
ncbi:RNase E specificity factor CsrD, partial [Klebsiella michiganensis]